jgi:hypothetical protein
MKASFYYIKVLSSYKYYTQDLLGFVYEQVVIVVFADLLFLLF